MCIIRGRHMKALTLILRVATAMFAIAGLLGFSPGGSIALVILGALNIIYGVYSFKKSKGEAWSSIIIGLFSIVAGFISA